MRTMHGSAHPHLRYDRAEMETFERLITADQYCNYEYDERLHDRRTELIHGRVVVNAPALPHQTLVGRIHLALGNWAAGKPGRGRVWLPLDLRIDDWSVLNPDLLWVAEARLPPPGTRRLEISPDIVIEVRSPSTWARDVGPKHALYERHGVRELWLVDDRSASVLRFFRAREAATTLDSQLELSSPETLSSPLLPGFALGLDELFDPAI
ncbi:MAG: Uma2 family endonuclease [Solirubrobacteraceae bacterium]